MDIDLALEIVKDHIRIGKGMELTNGVPEALEMVVDEFEQKKNLVERYATSARVIDLYLKEFCDTSLPYDEMIAEASRRASEELVVTRRALELAQAEFKRERREHEDDENLSTKRLNNMVCMQESINNLQSELEQYKRALELACLRLCHQIPDNAQRLQECYLSQAKAGDR